MLSDRVDDRSERVIATLLSEVQPYAGALETKAVQHGSTIEVISEMRTYEEQKDLYAQGRTKPGRIVTKARGGFSNHNFGIGLDLGVFEGTKSLDDSRKYKAVGVLGMDLGLEWGGNWRTIVDRTTLSIASEVGRRHERERYAGGAACAQGLEERRVRVKIS